MPALTGALVDEAGLLASGEASSVRAALDDFNAARRGQMAVAIVKSLEGFAIEEASLAVATAWKLGQAPEKKGAAAGDNGILLLIAVGDRQMRLEIGYGLEGTIPDVYAARILDGVLRPALRAGQPGRGITEVVRAVDARLANPQVGVPALQPRSRQVGGSNRLFFLGGTAVLFLVALLASVRRFVPLFIVWLLAGKSLAIATAMLVVLAIPLLLTSIFGHRLRRRGGGSGTDLSQIFALGSLASTRRGGFFGGGGGGFGGGGFGGGGFSGGGGSFGGGGSSSSW